MISDLELFKTRKENFLNKWGMDTLIIILKNEFNSKC